MDDITTATRHCPMGGCSWDARLAGGCGPASRCPMPEARWTGSTVLPTLAGATLLGLLVLAGGAVVVLFASLTVLVAGTVSP